MLKNISSCLLKGLIFGIFAFIIAQIAIPIMRSILEMPAPAGGMLPMTLASLAGHVVFGIVVVLVARE